MLPTKYTIRVRHTEEDLFEITIPEFPEVQVSSTTLDEAVTKAQEAVSMQHYEEWQKIGFWRRWLLEMRDRLSIFSD